MKTQLKNVSISGVLSFVLGALFAILLMSVFASCSASRHWYKPIHGGCQSSQGMPGY